MRDAEFSIPDPPARLHFVGVGGIGVSGLARVLRGRGYDVSGSDLLASDVTVALEREGIDVAIGHAASNVAGADIVITTAAAPDHNVELVAARDAGIPVVKRAVVLGHIARRFRTLAVAGSHGKSTTSGMAAVAMDVAGYCPGFAVGAIAPHFGSNALDSTGAYFVVEADEYDHSFLQLSPDVAIITNIEHDHPDLFEDIEEVLDAFGEFVNCIRPAGTLVISAGDPGCQLLLGRIGEDADLRVVTFGSEQGDWRLAAPDLAQAQDGRMFELRLAVPGRHNRLNALAVLAASEPLGLDTAKIAEGLAEFRGVSRRFEVVRDDQEFVVVSDYAHHPSEIAATVAAAREQYPGRRILAVFQPHTYSRTAALLENFASSLDSADVSVIAEIYAARETDDLGVSAMTIADLMDSPVEVAGSPEDASRRALELARTGDVVLVLGAGDIVRAAASIAKGRP